ncbi:MAG: ABC transporter permease [Nitrospirae bacterium]|nr:ABC transporter permease [Nitrospirota bacterium]
MGRMVLFLLATIGWLFRPPFRLFQVFKQVHFVGFKSTFVVVLTAAFTGMVLALQGYYTLRKYGSESALGSAVALSIIRELGPVLAALMVTARAGSAMTADLLGGNPGSYWSSIEAAVEWKDVYGGILKSISFGLIVTWVCCYKGYFTRMSAEGLGAATTEAVVLASVLVLVWDYFLTSVLL